MRAGVFLQQAVGFIQRRGGRVDGANIRSSGRVGLFFQWRGGRVAVIILGGHGLLQRR